MSSPSAAHKPFSPVPPTAAPPVPRLFRSPQQRLLGGVSRGLSVYLGADVRVIRAAFLVSTFAGGLGSVLYAAFWVFVPLADTPLEPVPQDERRFQRRSALLLLGSALGVGVFIEWRGTFSGDSVEVWIWPLLVCGVGVALLWRQADDTQRARWLALDVRGRRAAVVRGVVGTALVGIGLGFFITYGAGLSEAFAALRGAVILLIGLMVIFGPYLLRLTRDLGAERRARIRAQERAEVAAHVHDSVLHTLTLIQRSVDDPRAVARLARAQERELRAWLYRPEGEDPDRTFAAAVRQEAAEVEDMHGVSIEVVCVGDCPVDERLAAQLAAAREAMVNAAKYAGEAAIDVFAEVEDDVVTVYVRDRGPGFDPDALPEDRLGVRESVLGRMRRNGGTAVIRSEPGEGTEIQLEMGRPRQ